MSNNLKYTATCSECQSSYYPASSRMAELCPECAHVLYGYDNCDHVFQDGHCVKCYWDGSVSDYVQSLKKRKESNS